MTVFTPTLRCLIPAVLLALSACKEAPAAPAAPAKTAAPVVKDVPADVAKTITDTLQNHYADQNLSVKKIFASPIAGIYEVEVNGKQLVYTDASGNYMLVGDLIRTADGTNLTEERQAELKAVDFASLPFDKAITEVRGNGALKVAVFSDADCPYCKRLEREFAKMDNITIYNFMMPIPSLHPDAERKAVQIWCSPDRTAAWTDWMRHGKLPAKAAECANPVAETTQLGSELGFNGTPTMVFPNGKVQSGYAPMPQLEAIIQANQP